MLVEQHVVGNFCQQIQMVLIPEQLVATRKVLLLRVFTQDVFVDTSPFGIVPAALQRSAVDCYSLAGEAYGIGFCNTLGTEGE